MLVAGCLDDLPAMQQALAMLPDGAYGQVFVETETPDDAVELAAPVRMTVTRLPRSTSRGEALGAAIAGWVAEWMPETRDDDEAATAWIGEIASAGLPNLSELRYRIARLHVLQEMTRLEAGTARS